MNNSYLVETGEVLGYCSIVPPVNEEHMFGDKVVKFAYMVGDLLFFNATVYPKNAQIENNFKYHTKRRSAREVCKDS